MIISDSDHLNIIFHCITLIILEDLYEIRIIVSILYTAIYNIFSGGIIVISKNAFTGRCCRHIFCTDHAFKLLVDISIIMLQMCFYKNTILSFCIRVSFTGIIPPIFSVYFFLEYTGMTYMVSA